MAGRQAPGARRRHKIALAAILAVTAYLAAAYLLLPALWGRDEALHPLTAGERVARTGDGQAGDPLNVAFTAAPEVLIGAFQAAGWHPADAITFETSVRIVDSVVFDRPDPDAPVSPLFYEGRREDLAFEKAVGTSADRRQHVRLWRLAPVKGRGVSWIGAVTFDEGVGFSHYTGAVTHRIAPDVDAARDALVADMEATGEVARTYEAPGIGPTRQARNGEGDPYFTDGEMRVVVLDGP